MKLQTLLALLLLVIAGCGCGKTERGNEKITPLFNKEIDIYFSEKIPNVGDKSAYFESVEKDSVFVINSEEKLKQLFPDFKFHNSINFSKNMLLVGQKRMPNRFYRVTNQFLEKGNNQYTLHLNVSLSEGSYPAFSWLYYWGVYRKIDKNTHIITKVNN